MNKYLNNNYSFEMYDKIEDNYQDYKWALGLNQFSLQLMGIWPNDKDFDSEPFFVRVRVPFMIIAMFFCLFLPQMYALALVIYELPLVIDNLMTSCAALTSCIKLFFIWRNKKILLPVVKSVTKDWLRPKEDWELKAMKRKAQRARLFTISGYIVIGGCYASFAFAPLFGLDIRMISNITDYGNRYLMAQSYFPYDYSKSPNFELTQASQLIAGFFIGMSVSIPDNYFAALVFHSSAQFEILGEKITNFIREDDKALRNPGSRKFNERLGSFIDRHVHLMTTVTAVEHSFSYVIFAQIFCMSCMVCCLGFQILGMFGGGSAEKPSPLQVLTLFGTLFTLMMHTLVDCFACETLATSSSGIFHDIYKSKWYTVPQHSTRDLIPMMISAMHPRRLSAGKILCLSLATYCSILKTTGGYISMLIAVTNR